MVPEKTGKTRQYLMDNFCHLPDDVNALKNGHMLFIFFTNDQSTAKTIRTVKDSSSPAGDTLGQVNPQV